MKRILTLMLAVIMLVSSVTMIFTSCDNDTVTEESKGPTTGNSTNEALEQGDIFAERALVDDELGEWDFGGRKLRVVCHNDGYEMFPAEDQINKGDLIKDAKAARNKTVEDRLNIDVELTYCADITTLAEYVSKAILSGSDEFDLVVNHVLTTGGMVTKNLFQNWYDIPHVDFNKPWWAGTTSTELTYDGKCIIAISDLCATTITSTSVIAFNKNLANSYDLGNLYDVVLNGDWTYDYFYNLIKDIYQDTDGSGLPSSGDFYGAIFPVENQTNAWLWAFDNPVCTKNEDGVPEFTIKSDKINNIVTTLYDFYFNTTGVASDDAIGDGVKQTMFLNKQSVFTTMNLGEATSEGFRNFEDDYGILPYPKWNEAQDEYYSHVYGEHTCLTVPKTVKDTEFVGVCTEILSAESWKTLTPTIYEIALKTRYLRDSESKEVLDIVLENRYFDFGFIYDNWQGHAYDLYNMLKNRNSNFESFYSKKHSTARVHLKKVIRAFDKLD